MKTIRLFAVSAFTVMGMTMCTQNKATDTQQDAEEDTKIYDIPVESANFPKGSSGDFLGDSLPNWINQNFVYPEEALKAGVEGRINVLFVVEKDGSLSNVRIDPSIDPYIEAEMLRVFSKMPAWEPAKDENGNPVRMRYVLAWILNARTGKGDTFHFTLEDDSAQVDED